MSSGQSGVSGKPHPGSSKVKTRAAPRGRQVLPAARQEVGKVLGSEKLRRDLLIEYLHRIQDGYGYLSTDHLAALAELMGLAQTEVYEVATFYAHFLVVREDQPPPPAITLRVCDSPSCEMAGATDLALALDATLDSGVRVLRAPCMGRCDTAPIVAVNQRHMDHATLETVTSCVKSGETSALVRPYIGLDDYVDRGGYQLLRQCREGLKKPDDIIKTLKHAALRGLGGAGFPTGTKWEVVRSYPGPRFVAVNADEGEPGTFKDRYHLERDPHRMLEGALIAAWAVEAETVFIYLRDEYPAIREILLNELAALDKSGLSANVKIELRRGAGAYICGEESAMLESIEGKRALPRHRPPYVAQRGLFGRPTLVNNVETLYWVRDIVQRGPDWFSGHGLNGAKGLRSYSVSGRVKNPGVKLAPAGITARELVQDYCGGMLDGHAFKAYLPGGASGGILPEAKADLPLDFGSLAEEDCFVGSHAVVIVSDQDNLRELALNLMRFFEDESCGQCTPCRVGTEKAVALMKQRKWDRELLTELARVMADASICGLGQAAPNPLLCVLRYFPEEFEL
jgi:NADH:ubiquinone oxidoreductase subunit F (NADH-binding)/NADH:ubiquinone oxidoreductase subunit E